MRVLIVRTDRIGDVVLSTAIPREIKKQYPDAFVAMMVRTYTKDLYQNNPYVDQVLTDDYTQENKKVTFIRKINELRKLKFTHALMLLPTERINWMMFFAGIKLRVGVGHKFYQFISGARSVSRRKYNPLRHEADYSMDLARYIGVKNGNWSPEIFLRPEERKSAEKFKAEWLNNRKFLLGIHTTSGNSAPNWKAEEYKILINLLQQEKSIKIAVTDDNTPEALKSIPDVIYPNSGKTLRKAIVNISALDLLVSASTGPMHIAAALKVKTISMFCPLTACSPKLWGPLGNHSQILLPYENYCRSVCPGDPKKCTFSGNSGLNAGILAARILNTLTS